MASMIIMSYGLITAIIEAIARLTAIKVAHAFITMHRAVPESIAMEEFAVE